MTENDDDWGDFQDTNVATKEELARIHNETTRMLEKETERLREELHRYIENRSMEEEAKLTQISNAINTILQQMEEMKHSSTTDMETRPKLKPGEERYILKVHSMDAKGRRYLMPVPGFEAMDFIPTTPEEIEEARIAYGDGKKYYVINARTARKVAEIDCRGLREYPDPMPREDDEENETVKALLSKIEELEEKLENNKGTDDEPHSTTRMLLDFYKERMEKMEEMYHELATGKKDEPREDELTRLAREKFMEELKNPLGRIEEVERLKQTLGIGSVDMSDDVKKVELYGKMADSIVEKLGDIVAGVAAGKEDVNMREMDPNDIQELKRYLGYLKTLNRWIENDVDLTNKLRFLAKAKTRRVKPYREMLLKYSEMGYDRTIEEIEDMITELKDATEGTNAESLVERLESEFEKLKTPKAREYIEKAFHDFRVACKTGYKKLRELTAAKRRKTRKEIERKKIEKSRKEFIEAEESEDERDVVEI